MTPARREWRGSGMEKVGSRVAVEDGSMGCQILGSCVPYLGKSI
jgi:hypothetical protein